MIKICGRCSLEKAVSEFHKRKASHRNTNDYRTEIISECEITKRWLGK